MASQVNVETIPFTAGATMQGTEYEILKYNSDGDGILCDDDTDFCVGVCYIDEPSRDPDNTGKELPMAPIDQPAHLKIKAGVALTVGHIAVPNGDTPGKIKGVAEDAIPHGVHGIGIILMAASAENEVVRVQPMRRTGQQAEIYTGAWSAGVYEPGQVARHANALYMCFQTTAAADGNPAANTADWEAISS